MQIDEKGLDMIKSFEGCKLSAYKCVASEKYFTIGFGHYGSDVHAGMTITEERATELLRNDVSGAELVVNEKVKVPITQSMFNALVSFVYNVGSGNFCKSTLIKKLNLKDYKGASEEFHKWRKSGGMVLRGLEVRREREKKEFLREGFPSEKQFIPSLKNYHGNSLVDGLKSQGYASNFSYRKELWKMIGKNVPYEGSFAQNVYLLNYLKNV